MSPLRNVGGRIPFATAIEPSISAQQRRHTVPPVEASFCETFPNDGVLGVTTEDQTWQVPSAGDAIIVGGELRGTAGFADGRMEVDAGSSDMFASCDINADVPIFYLVARCGDTGDLYSDDGIYLFVNGSVVSTYIEVGGWQSGFYNSDTVPVSSEGNWRLELVGTTARVLRNGVEQLTADVSGNTATGQRAGFELISATVSTPTVFTVTESFNKADGVTIGPDRVWLKQSTVNNGGNFGTVYTDDGVITSNQFGLQGHDGMFGGVDDGYAFCDIMDSNNDTQFSEFEDAYVQARITGLGATGTHEQVGFTLSFRTNAYMAFFVTDTTQRVSIDGGGLGSGPLPCTFGNGDLLRIESDVSANEFRALINGVVVATCTPSFASILNPHLSISAGAYNAPFTFTRAGQDRLDQYEAHGTVNVFSYPGGIDNFCIGSL